MGGRKVYLVESKCSITGEMKVRGVFGSKKKAQEYALGFLGNQVRVATVDEPGEPQEVD